MAIHKYDIDSLEQLSGTHVTNVTTTEEVVTIFFSNGSQLELSDIGEQGWSLWMMRKSHSK